MIEGLNGFGNLGNASAEQLQDLTLQKGGSLELRAQKLKEGGDEAALKKFSEDFESLFIQRLLKEMRKSIPKEGVMLEKSMSMEWFESMFDEAVADEISKGNGVGLSKVIYEQMTRKAGVDRPHANLADYRDQKNIQGIPGKSALKGTVKPELGGGFGEE